MLKNLLETPVSSVIEYLGRRYTHKIAINNHRIKAVKANRVTFQIKNYKKQGKPVSIRPNAS
jgi:hypothetical protein